jgi:tRNA modification GTPase
VIHINPNTTICALSTAAGVGAIAVIRISGKNTLNIVNGIFSKEITAETSHTLHYGIISNNQQIIDEVVVAWFKGPNSFTGEDVAEISCHGSTFIQQKILELLLEKGCVLAQAGEFTMRAFANGKLDLSQAEAIADVIASSSEAEHKLAVQQLRGHFSKKIEHLRQELINFASLLELELDFAEEDVEFADRKKFLTLVHEIVLMINELADSFKVGNAIKNGIPIVIAGAPNAGKSTLLNVLLNEDRAIVSDIAGTTRDVIEDEVILHGVKFRFIDTAGLRETNEEIESIGIEKAYAKIKVADVVLYLIDATKSMEEINFEIQALKNNPYFEGKKVVYVLNKTDNSTQDIQFEHHKLVKISAKQQQGIDELKQHLVELVSIDKTLNQTNVVVTNVRHYKALLEAKEALVKAHDNLKHGTSSEFVAMDVREAIHHLGAITGQVTTDDLLGNIFSKFCIGK